jgi:hypothetical protein
MRKSPRAAKAAATPKRAPKGGAGAAEAPKARKTAVAARRRNATQTSRATPETAKRSRRKAS